MNPAPAEPGEEMTNRQRALTQAIAVIRRPRSGRFPLATVFLVLGGILLPVGFVAILLGWYGIAHTLNVYEQNSYLISGGILGLGLIIVGCFFYFGYLMTKQLEVMRAAIQQATAALADLRAVPPAPQPSSNGKGPHLVATERGSMVHWADCPVVAQKTNLRDIEPAAATGMRACQICDPFATGEEAAPWKAR